MRVSIIRFNNKETWNKVTRISLYSRDLHWSIYPGHEDHIATLNSCSIQINDELSQPQYIKVTRGIIHISNDYIQVLVEEI